MDCYKVFMLEGMSSNSISLNFKFYPIDSRSLIIRYVRKNYIKSNHIKIQTLIASIFKKFKYNLNGREAEDC